MVDKWHLLFAQNSFTVRLEESVPGIEGKTVEFAGLESSRKVLHVLEVVPQPARVCKLLDDCWHLSQHAAGADEQEEEEGTKGGTHCVCVRRVAGNLAGLI